MDLTKYAGANFITLETVRDKTLRETVAEVSEGQFGKPVLTFESGKMVSVNKTSIKELIKAFGTKSSDLVGQRVEVSAGQIPFKGQLTDAVLVMPLNGVGRAARTSPAVKPRTRPAADDEVDDE